MSPRLPSASSGRIRGRIIACDHAFVLIRTAAGDVKVPRSAGMSGVEAGDLIAVDGDGGEPEVVRSFLRGEYPSPDTEMGRLAGGRMERLQARSRVMRAVRQFFAARDFCEVETPLLVPAPGLEIHLRAVSAGVGQWLVTSPEFQMKRLLAGGMERVYSLGKCFRDGEVGAHHAAEFTMLEWYRAWSSWEEILADTVALVGEAAFAVNGAARVTVRGRAIDVSPPWLRLTVTDAMARFAGVTLRPGQQAPELAAGLVAAGIDLGGAQAWDDLFFTAFLARVEPAIAAQERPVILYDWPVELGALARRKDAQPWLVERFEVYIGGVELCNAFGELTDPLEQRDRFDADRITRIARGLPPYPVDGKFLAALEEGIPPSAGIALGVDRLVMLVTGADDISQVLAFTAAET